MVEPNMARVFRDMVRDLFRHAPKAVQQDDAALLAFLDEEYRRCRMKVDQDPSDETERVGLFLFASGLLAFGRLEADIVEAILSRPTLKGSIDRLAGTVPVLLPLPEDADPLRDPAAVLQWLDDNRHRLAFSEELGRFVLVD